MATDKSPQIDMLFIGGSHEKNQTDRDISPCGSLRSHGGGRSCRMRRRRYPQRPKRDFDDTDYRQGADRTDGGKRDLCVPAKADRTSKLQDHGEGHCHRRFHGLQAGDPEHHLQKRRGLSQPSAVRFRPRQHEASILLQGGKGRLPRQLRRRNERRRQGYIQTDIRLYSG